MSRKSSIGLRHEVDETIYRLNAEVEAAMHAMQAKFARLRATIYDTVGTETDPMRCRINDSPMLRGVGILTISAPTAAAQAVAAAAGQAVWATAVLAATESHPARPAMGRRKLPNAV
jgi:hypothetical protein